MLHQNLFFFSLCTSTIYYQNENMFENICVQFDECVTVYNFMCIFLNVGILSNFDDVFLEYTYFAELASIFFLSSRPISNRILSNVQIFMITLLPVL